MASRLFAVGAVLGAVLAPWMPRPPEPLKAESRYHVAVFDAATGQPVSDGYVVVYNRADVPSVDNPQPFTFAGLTSKLTPPPLPDDPQDSPFAQAGFRLTVDADAVYEVRYRGPGYEAAVPLATAVDGPAGLKGIPIAVSRLPREQAPVDTDGDGLYDIDEERLGTSLDLADTDSDGLSDLFEAEFAPASAGSNLLNASDVDGDGLTNVDEFLRQSDPNVQEDPQPVWFISSARGNDAQGDGSFDRPMQTVNGTLTRLKAYGAFGDVPLVAPVELVDPDHPVLLFLQDGEYVEDVNLVPGIYLRGTSQGTVTIRGSVTFTRANRVSDLTLRPPAEGSTVPALLRGAADSEGIAVDHVSFVGGTGYNGAGVLIESEARRRSVLRDCEFSRFPVALEVQGTLPAVCRCSFSGATVAAVVVRSNARLSDPGGLGDEADPNTGWNAFGESSGLSILNETDVLVKAENNDWGTPDLTEIAQRVSGPVDFDPPLQRGELLNVSTLVCTLSRAGSQNKRVLDAEVEASGRTTVKTRANDIGVYVFDALPAGRYTVRATAPGYRSGSRLVDVTSQGITYLVLPLQASTFKGDLDDDGKVNAVDLQLVANSVLRIPLPVGINPDMNGDGKRDSLDVQLVVNAILGLV